jgi:hypothetical protein
MLICVLGLGHREPVTTAADTGSRLMKFSLSGFNSQVTT